MTDGISIVICTYNGKDKLVPTLEHIVNQNCNFPYELILVDNASTDGTKEFVDQWWKLYGRKDVKYTSLIEPKPGKTFAQELGFSAVRHKFILICDDDNWFSRDYLLQAHDILISNPKIGMLGGMGEAVSNAELPHWFENHKHMYAVGPQDKNEGNITKTKGFVYGAGSVIRTDNWMAITSNAELLLSCRTGDSLVTGGDNEMGYLIVQSGLEVHWYSSLKFKHYIPSNRLNIDYLVKLRAGVAIVFEILKYYKKKLGIRTNQSRHTVLEDFFESAYSLLKIPINYLLNRIHYRSMRMQMGFHSVRFWQILRHGFTFSSTHSKIDRNLLLVSKLRNPK